ncbi:MAG: hypothetical protein KY475_11080 [Planctomycetes bacterium]|nr:hypothetical protein [Planctomycetota bacterium]
MLNFRGLSLPANAAVFTVASLLVWFAGARLSVYADAIAERKALGRAFVGALFLGVVTSLPEIATTVTASALGNAPLAVNNLLGSVVMQFVVLAVIDLLFVRGALTFFAPKPVLLLSGVLLALQLALAAAAIAAGDLAFLGRVGLWPVLLASVYAGSVYFLYHYEGRKRWAPVDVPDESYKDRRAGSEVLPKAEQHSTRRLYLLFCANSLLVVAAGWAISSTGDALALQTGLGSGFLGATLLALATSLPEVSTTYGAVKVGAYTMGVANIFGTNALGVALLFPADIVYGEGPIIAAVGPAEIFLCALGIVLTCLFLWGMLERRNRTVLRMGVDSALVLAAWMGGVAVLYSIT